MKLELKHLAPYLPYNLMFVGKNTEHTIWKLEGLRSIEQRSIELSSKEYDLVHATLDKVQPILRPLTDLTKEIEVNGERFVPIDKIEKTTSIHLHYESDTLIWVNDPTNEGNWLQDHFKMMQMLLYWHFDIYNLIQHGLAVDYNTLNKQ